MQSLGIDGDGVERRHRRRRRSELEDSEDPIEQSQEFEDGEAVFGAGGKHLVQYTTRKCSLLVAI